MRFAVLRVLCRDRPPTAVEVEVGPSHVDHFAATLRREQSDLLDSSQRLTERTERIAVRVRLGALAPRRLLLFSGGEPSEQRPQRADFVVGQGPLARVFFAGFFDTRRRVASGRRVALAIVTGCALSKRGSARRS